ncbi:hypothetical protein [Nocardia anaemiae]|uniref:hypothetical protein n=1 Tax=Nocardia anaemiae TaxID=263910 RepID=UPI0007A4D3C7|nr:hypothetical protein [Nocardia anaemiae]
MTAPMDIGTYPTPSLPVDVQESETAQRLPVDGEPDRPPDAAEPAAVALAADVQESETVRQSEDVAAPLPAEIAEPTAGAHLADRKPEAIPQLADTSVPEAWVDIEVPAAVPVLADAAEPQRWR